MNVISRRLEALRGNRSQKQIEQYAGVKQRTLSAWEQGKVPDAFKWIAQLAKYYGVTTDYLLGITDDSTFSMLGMDIRGQTSSTVNEAPVIYEVQNPFERALTVKLLDKFRRLSREDQEFVVELMDRVVHTDKPRIIGDEP